MPPQIQAIPTEYRGFRFRSRIEARWAVFFDTLGIPFEYEADAYYLSSGNYLPDFWLPTLECFAEIKGAEPTAIEVQKGEELAEVAKHPVLFLYGGIPDIGQIESLAFTPFVSFGNGRSDYPYHFCQCSICGTVGVEFEGRADRLACTHGWDFEKAYRLPALVNAYHAARGYRFEPGATNKPAAPAATVRAGSEFEGFMTDEKSLREAIKFIPTILPPALERLTSSAVWMALSKDTGTNILKEWSTSLSDERVEKLWLARHQDLSPGFVAYFAQWYGFDAEEANWRSRIDFARPEPRAPHLVDIRTKTYPPLSHDNR